MSDSTIHVLHAVPDMNSAGIENYIMNMYREIDRSQIQFDFLLHHSYESHFEAEIKSLGGCIYKYPVLENKNVLGYMSYLKDVFSSHPEIRVVHGHMCSLACFYLGQAKKAGVPARICHSHNTSHEPGAKGNLKYLLSRMADRSANYRLACSTEAGIYLFGKSDFQVAKNAIDAKRFTFSESSRKEIRDSLGIDEDVLVIGHIGRFEPQKNHSFLIDILGELNKMAIPCRLVLVGRGFGKDAVVRQVEKLGLDNQVEFVEVTKTPEKYYSAFDAFVLPSRYEGMPLVGVEAQCSGLPTFLSSTITQETKISELARYLKLEDSAYLWAKEIAAFSSTHEHREAYYESAVKSGYDAISNARLMSEYYGRIARG